MAIGLVQSAFKFEDLASTPTEVVLGSTPTAGNLLLLFMNERGATPDGYSMVTTGYTFLAHGRFEDADSTHRRGMAVYYRIADGGESTTVSSLWEGSVSNGNTSLVVEYSGMGDYSYEGYVWSDNGTTLDATTLDTGDLTTAGPAALFVLFSVKRQQTTPSSNVSTSYSDSDILEGVTQHPGVSYGQTLASAYGEKESAGTYSSTTTMAATSTLNRNLTQIFISFSAETGGAEIIEYQDYARNLIIS